MPSQCRNDAASVPQRCRNHIRTSLKTQTRPSQHSGLLPLFATPLLRRASPSSAGEPHARHLEGRLRYNDVTRCRAARYDALGSFFQIAFRALPSCPSASCDFSGADAITSSPIKSLVQFLSPFQRDYTINILICQVNSALFTEPLLRFYLPRSSPKSMPEYLCAQGCGGSMANPLDLGLAGLNNPYFVLGQAVEVIDDIVNSTVEGSALILVVSLFLISMRLT